MELTDLHFISWSDFHVSAFSLAQKIQKDNENFDIIIAISRGGLVLARILSDFLNLPIYNIAIESYTDINKHKEPQVTQEIESVDLHDKKILLVDEICDSGKTFERGVLYLKSVMADRDLALQLKTACLILKSHSSFCPDFYEKVIDKWVVFPYEIRETVEGLKDKFKIEDFVRLGFNSKLIEYFYK